MERNAKADLDLTGCVVENVTVKAYRCLGGLVGTATMGTDIAENTLKNITLVYLGLPYGATEEEGKENGNYGAIAGRLLSNSTATDNTVENFTAPGEPVIPGDPGDSGNSGDSSDEGMVEVEVTFDPGTGSLPAKYIASKSDVLSEITIDRYGSVDGNGTESTLYSSGIRVWWYYIALSATDSEGVYQIKEVGYNKGTAGYALYVIWHDSLSNATAKAALDKVYKNPSSYVGKFVTFVNVPAASSADANITMKIIDNPTKLSVTLKGSEALPTASKNLYKFVGWQCSLDNEIYTEYPGYTSNPGAFTYTAVYEKLPEISPAENTFVVNPLWATEAVGNKVMNGKYTYVVGTNGFATIADALAAAKEGATINVLAGTYNEKLTISVKGVSILGPNASVKGYGNRAAEAVFTGTMNVEATASGLTIKGLHFGGDDSLYLTEAFTGNSNKAKNIFANYITNVTLENNYITAGRVVFSFGANTIT